MTTLSSFPVSYQIPYPSTVAQPLVVPQPLGLEEPLVEERVIEEVPTSVRILKRTLDVAIASIGLILCSWLFPLLAVLIYLDSPGPILYRQRRAGMLKWPKGGGLPVCVEFEMLKFRTMRPDAERLTGMVLASQDDPRITRVGRLMRKTRLDELPQLWNVLRGEMSMVGPRPERPELFSQLSLAIPFFEERMRGVKPGITGLAQVSLGYSGHPLAGSPVNQHLADLTNPYKLDQAEGALADDMRIKLLYDLAYVAALDDFSTYIRTELLVLLKTPMVMLAGLGR
jgi:lipopolysaccharide/colanic/teichoic acid biosynthesis glycosyltransferase